MKSWKFSVFFALLFPALCAGLAGCGGGGTGAITTTVTLSSTAAGNVLILGQSTTITATVVGPTNTDVTWGGGSSNTPPCTYTTTPAPTTSVPNPTASAALPCPQDTTHTPNSPNFTIFGSLTNEQTTGPGTLTFTAPSTLPDPTKYPNLVVIVTACSVAQTNKCGTISLLINSGVGVTLTPPTASVPTGEQEPFFAIVANDSTDPTKQGVTWVLTQQSPVSTTTTTNSNPYSSLATCTVSGNASGCGSISAAGVYTAPTAVPTNTTPQNTSTAPTDCTTPQIVTIVAISKNDPTRFATGVITITQGGPITFSGISPTIAPQGAAYWDIFLNAPDISSATLITLNGNPFSPTKTKVLLPIPSSTSSTTTVTPPGCSTSTTLPTNIVSTGVRIRLDASDLASAGPVTVSISDPAQPCNTIAAGNPCAPTGTGTFNVIPVRPTVTSSTPNDIIQNTVVQQNEVFPLTIDGGYFGEGGLLASNVTFGNVTLTGQTSQDQPLSSAKQLDLQFPSGSIDTSAPGLYSLSVSRNTPPLPVPNNPAISDLAVFPSYSMSPPTAVASVTLPPGSNPSAVDIDPTLGVLAVAETSANQVQFYNIGQGTLTAVGPAIPVGKLPTSVSVNRANHTAAVVNYGDQTVNVISIPSNAVVGSAIDLSGVLQGAVTTPPLPYSIGVDPDTNMAVVAFSSTSSSAFASANLGFLLDLNPNGTTQCLTYPNAPTAHPCAFAQVTLNTGAYPQVATAPHGHIAFVSPGGSGFLRGVDVTKPSASIGITKVVLAAGTVTVTTVAPPTVNGVAQTLFPGNSGTVLITGIPGPNSAGNSTSANFNGAYTVTAVSDTSFIYVVNSTASTTINTTDSSGNPTATAFFSNPDFTFSGPNQADQGIAINPITNTAALADFNSTGSNGAQIDIINNLDQSTGAIAFTGQCTAYVTLCPSSAPELLGTADIAWQPYTNSIVSYNPTINQVSVSDPVSARRYALVCDTTTGTPAANCIVDPSNPPTASGSPVCPNVGACSQMYQAQTTLAGTGTATLNVSNGTTGKLNLFGGLAVDPATNQAFVVMSGSNQIDIVNLGQLKPAQITEVVVPPPAGSPAGSIGGIPGATVPQGTLTSATDLANVQIFGSGFDSGTAVHLDATAIPQANVTAVNSRQLTVTIPASFLSFPHRYALDVVNSGGSQSNATDFYVVQAVDLSQLCPPAVTHPSSVVIADQIRNGPFSPIALVTNSGCNNVAVVDINPTATINNQVVQNPNFGKVRNTVSVGAGPQGIAVSQPFGLAVVANNTAGTASIVDLVANALAVPDVGTGTNPTGVAISDATGAALVANTGSNTLTQLNLGLLFGSSPATTLSPVSIGGVQQPTAIAIDPDAGTNSQGLAAVTELELQSGAAPQGAIASVDISSATPVLGNTSTLGSVTAPATGIVFDPTVVTAPGQAGVFYVSSSGGNVITSFDPNGGSSASVNVGINPTALAINPQTGAILTTNVSGKTVSLVDTTASRLKTVQTIGLPGSAEFGVAIDQFTNLAVIVDQANNRLFILPASK